MSLNFIILILVFSASIASIPIFHPISLAGVVIMQALLICSLGFFIYSTAWYSFIVFLIFLGGVIVIFLYVTRLASNENFAPQWKSFILLITLTIFFSPILLFRAQENNLKTQINPSIIVSKIYSFQLAPIIVVSIIFLLFTLIVVAEIVKLTKTPLRSIS